MLYATLAKAFILANAIMAADALPQSYVTAREVPEYTCQKATKKVDNVGNSITNLATRVTKRGSSADSAALMRDCLKLKTWQDAQAEGKDLCNTSVKSVAALQTRAEKQKARLENKKAAAKAALGRRIARAKASATSSSATKKMLEGLKEDAEDYLEEWESFKECVCEPKPNCTPPDEVDFDELAKQAEEKADAEAEAAEAEAEEEADKASDEAEEPEETGDSFVLGSIKLVKDKPMKVVYQDDKDGNPELEFSTLL